MFLQHETMLYLATSSVCHHASHFRTKYLWITRVVYALERFSPTVKPSSVRSIVCCGFIKAA